MIQPKIKDEAWLAEVRNEPPAPGHFYLWWLGQSGFLIQWQGRFLLLDPYLSDSLTRKYAGTNKPHVRMTERIVDPARLDFIDVVTSTHNHTDHLDADTLRPLLQATPGVTVVVPEANRVFAAERLHVPPDRLTAVDAGGSVSASGFRFNAIPAAHEELERDEAGRYRYLGYVVEFGPWVVYYSGDTLSYEGMTRWLAPWRLDLMLLPINGRDPNRGVAGNLDGAEAARLAKDVRARLVIPCHYEMFEFNTATPELFVRAAQELEQPCRVLACGERWCSCELPTH